MKKKKILMLCSSAGSLIHFRGDFIKSLIANGFTVFGGAPDISDTVSNKLIALGAIPVEYKLQRTGLNPFKDIRSILEIKKIIDKNDIDLVFPYTIKPVIYGSIAANLLKVPVISLITGLGFTFSGTSLKSKILQKVTEFLYKISVRTNKIIVFQNLDDHDLFVERHIISKHQKFDVVDGSGVNLLRYPYRVNKNSSDKIIFVLVARLIKEKGVELFISAAEILKKSFSKAEFHVIGVPDTSPSAIKLEKLHDLHSKKSIVYHGSQNNVSDFLFESDIFVLPTYYREGVPRSILEALSIGMPIITTDSPGCRETVINGENGILIESKNLDALVNAMEFFLKNPDTIEKMGINSRNYATERFDVTIINKKLIDIINNQLN